MPEPGGLSNNLDELSSSDNSSDSDQDDDHSQQEGRDLSPEEMDKLVQFQDITGIEDIQICRALLESNNWDLETTAREHLNLPTSSQDRHGPIVRPIAPHAQAPEMVSVFSNNAADRNVNGGRHGQGGGGVVPAGLFSWTIQMLTLPIRWPLNFAYRALTGIFQFVASFFGFGPAGGRPMRLWPPMTPYNPEHDMLTFVTSFNEEFGEMHPNFFAGTYAQALDKAKKDLQFLVVYLHYPNDEQVKRFCRTTLADPLLINYIEENNLLFWGCSVESGEGYRVSQVFRERRYPFLAVVVLRQNRMMIVGRYEVFLTTNELTTNLTRVIRENEAYIVAARAEREERLINQQIRLEQDAALQESLRQDQEKERQKREVEERKRRAEEEERREREEAEMKKQNIRRLKIDLADRIPDQPDPNTPDVVQILIKLPNGQRLERRFLKKDSIKSLFFYVFCHPDSPDEFDITTNFPRKVIPCKPDDINNIDVFDAPSFEEAGIHQSTTLFVNDLDA